MTSSFGYESDGNKTHSDKELNIFEGSIKIIFPKRKSHAHVKDGS